MGGDEIDAGPAAPALAVEYVAGAEQPACQRGWRRLGAPVIAGGVAKLVVPFSPTGREVADLIAAGSGIPGLGDQLDRREQRVLVHRLQEAALLVEAVDFSREDGAEIEAEAVDVHVTGPVAQA